MESPGHQRQNRRRRGEDVHDHDRAGAAEQPAERGRRRGDRGVKKAGTPLELAGRPAEVRSLPGNCPSPKIPTQAREPWVGHPQPTNEAVTARWSVARIALNCHWVVRLNKTPHPNREQSEPLKVPPWD